jgi:hypothetical protein
VYAYLNHLAVLASCFEEWTSGANYIFKSRNEDLERLEWLRAQDRTALEELMLPLLRNRDG